MSNILLLNKIAKVGTDIFDDKYTVSDNCENADAIMVRSASMHDMDLPASVKAIARAGAGVNNIPVEECAKKGIVVFNTPGANANGVKELAIAALLLASRNITGGIEWVKTLAGKEDAAKVVEKNKSAYAGVEIKGKTLGVIGLGAIGGLVANAAAALGMNVIGCDPYLTVEGAWGLSTKVKKAASYEEIFAKSDYISVHVPATKETKDMFCEASFAQMKDGVRIINLSRSELVNSRDMIKAVADKKVACYVTDFATPDIIGIDNIIVIPHLGASTNESEDNCAVMAAKQIVDYLENGNIVNSVNFPSVVVDRGGLSRCCVLHYNVPAVISGVSSAFAGANINIEHFLNRSKGEFAYTVIDFNAELPASVLEAVKATEGVIAVNVIN